MKKSGDEKFLETVSLTMINYVIVRPFLLLHVEIWKLLDRSALGYEKHIFPLCPPKGKIPLFI
jgi:hypothetical protein